MSEIRMVTVAVDAVGGDFAPQAILAGVSAALAEDSELSVLIVGPSDVVEPFAATAGPRATPIVATEIIRMDDHPAQAVRAKRDSSIVVGCRLVKEGKADAFFSAGSTGAAMSAATLVMGRLRGILRPAIATVVPTGGPPVVLLDVGANADCKPEYLAQFAQMGTVYARAVLGVENPRVGLLNIGEEATKGSQLAVDAHVLMAATVAGFVGNVEGRDLTTGVADVIVTDGFTGNVALKLLEGTSTSLLKLLKRAMTTGLVNSLAAAVLKPSLSRMRDELDPDTYGGAPLLGVDGVCIIGHGSSSARAVANALKVAARAVRHDLAPSIAAAVSDQ